MNASLIINPNSGPKSIIKDLDKAVELLTKNGIEVEKHISNTSSEAENLTKKAVEDNLDLVIVAGGDGTINAVSNHLLNTKIPLAIIPTGTANVLANELNIPTRKMLNSSFIEESVKVILEENIKEIDLGKVTFENDITKHFTMWCGIGLDAILTNAKKTPPQNSLGRIINYINWFFSIIKLTIKYKGTKLEYKLNDEVHKEKLLQMLISNGSIYANFFKVSKSVRLDDGILNLIILKDKNKILLFYHLLISALTRRLRSDISMQIKKVSIKSERVFPIHLDAETNFSKSVEIEIVPKALRVIVPK